MVERHDLFAASQIPEFNAVGLSHARDAAADQTLSHTLTTRAVGNENSPDTGDHDGPIPDGDLAARPPDMADVHAVVAGDDVDIVGRVTIRSLRVPPSEVMKVLGVEQRTDARKTVMSQLVVCNDADRQAHRFEATAPGERWSAGRSSAQANIGRGSNVTRTATTRPSST